jgi:spore coat protein CotH
MLSTAGHNNVYKGISLLSGGLLVVFLCCALAGCTGLVSGQASDGNSAPFFDDRVAAVRIVMTEEDWDITLENPRAEEYVKADFWFDDELVPDVAVRPKGNSSLMTAAQLGTACMSLKIDFNFFNSARTFQGLKKVNLNNGFSDPTLIRETLGYELFELIGLPTPRTSFVDVWVNDTHLGLYTMVEQVDQTFLDNNFIDSTGNLYKPEMPAAYLNWTEADLPEQPADQVTDADDSLDINLGGGKLSEIMQALEQEDNAKEVVDVSRIPQIPPDGLPAGNIPIRDFNQRGFPPGGLQDNTVRGGVNMLEQMRLKTNENNPDHSALLRLLEVLNNEPDETFPEEIEEVLDVDQVLRYLAVSVTLVHLDNYIAMGHNYYLYEIDGKFTIIPWDLNMCFGTFNYGLDRNQIINYYIDEPTGGAMAERPLVNRLLSYQPYLKTYQGYLKELLDGPFSPARMNSRIDELAALIRPYIEADELKFFSTEQFEKGLEQGFSVTGMVPGGRPLGLKSFVSERSQSIQAQLAGIRKSGSGDGDGNGGSFGTGGQMGGRRN